MPIAALFGLPPTASATSPSVVLDRLWATPPPLTTDLFAGDRWLAVTVNGEALSPWLRVGMVPTRAQEGPPPAATAGATS